MRRLFVAAELPARVRSALAGAAPGAPWRPLGADDLHVTLAFLGGRPEEDVDVLRGLLAGDLGRVAPAALGETVLLPPRRPRVCAVRVVSPGLEAVQARVAGLLVEAGALEPESRPFLPHVTVARTRERARRVRLDVEARFEISSVALMESRQPDRASAGGPAPRYIPLARSTLRG